MYHGRESYRKNCHITYLSIYKSLLLVIPLVIFGAYSGFSGTCMYDSWMIQLFSLLFTSLPLITYGLMDRQYEKEVLLRNPVLYENGIFNALFNEKNFLYWIVYSGL